MSHFNDVAASRDIAYGESNCLRLAQRQPRQARELTEAATTLPPAHIAFVERCVTLLSSDRRPMTSLPLSPVAVVNADNQCYFAEGR